MQKAKDLILLIAATLGAIVVAIKLVREISASPGARTVLKLIYLIRFEVLALGAWLFAMYGWIGHKWPVATPILVLAYVLLLLAGFATSPHPIGRGEIAVAIAIAFLSCLLIVRMAGPAMFKEPTSEPTQAASPPA